MQHYPSVPGHANGAFAGAGGLYQQPHAGKQAYSGQEEPCYLQQHYSGTPTAPPAGIAAIADPAAALRQKCRNRWLDDCDDDAHQAGDGSTDFIPAIRPQPAAGPAGSSGHIVRMRRGEAWAKFLAYEGCCQVCMKEGSRGVQAAAYFLSSGCEPLRSGLGITSLLLPQVLAGHLASAAGGGLDLGNEIHWDDTDAVDRRLNAAAFLNHMNVMKVRVARLDLAQGGMNVLSRLVCRNIDYSRITVHFRLVPGEALQPPVDTPFRLRKDGGALPGSPVIDLQPEHNNQEVLLEVVQGGEVLARGKVACKRLWQIGMEHASPGTGESEDEAGGDADLSAAPRGSICHWMAASGDTQLRGATALYVNVYDSGPTPGKVLLLVQRAQREMASSDVAPTDESGGSKGTLKVSSCQAYDFVLQAALDAQGCNEKRLEVGGEWAWLLQAFASHYGVRSNYAAITHLRWVLRPGIASASQGCFDLLARQLRPLLEQEASPGSLTKQEATMLAKVKSDTEELLKLAFENYHLLSSCARKGILDGACSPPPGHSEFPPQALVAGVQLFEAMRDVFHPSDVEWLGDRFRIAAKGRWSRLANLMGDDGGQQDGCTPLMTGTAPLRQHKPSGRNVVGGPGGKAAQQYAKMLRLAAAIKQDLEYDRRLQEVPRLLPSSLNIAAVTAAEYCANYVHHLRSVLGQCPPNQPTEVVIDLLVGVAQLQRYLDEHQLSVARGQPGFIDALELFGPHVRSWITHSQEALCAACRALEASTELGSLQSAATQAAPPLGSSEEGGVAPICAEMLRNTVNEMQRFERVITHWPLFGPFLEAAVCVVLRAVLAAVSRQCGMTRIRAGAEAAAAGAGSPFKMRAASPAFGDMMRSGGRPHSTSAQWAWAQDSPRKLAGNGARRMLLMVREAVLLNSLKRLMVAVPQYEISINQWSGGQAQPPPGGQQGQGLSDVTAALGYEDCAPQVGAQFAQVVKELRTEYSSAVSSTCQRLTAALAANPATSIYAMLSQAKATPCGGVTPMQQAAMVEGLSAGMLSCLHELLGGLAGALDSRVFVATGRGLWDFVGRDLLDFVQNLQEDKDNKGAWRTRQNASLLLEHVNRFFRAHLVQAVPHNLQEQDLAMPLHIECTQKLLAGNTTALNQSFTPF